MNMESTQRKAFIGLVALTLMAAAPVMAQDTTATERSPQPGQQDADTLTMPGQGGAADTAGYSGMERQDTSAAGQTGARPDTSGAAGEVETGAAPTDTGADQADTSAQARAPQTGGQTGGGDSKDPNGFRWTEPSDFARAGQTPPVGATEAVQPKPSDQGDETGAVQPSGTDSTKWGRDTETDPSVQNPPGYRGMERDTTQVPPGAAEDASTPTSRTEQMERQSESGQDHSETSDSTKNE
jgi:hypothetical protein